MNEKKLTFICMVPFSWGRGNTETEAIANAKKIAGRTYQKDKKHLLFLCEDPKAFVDEMGTLCFKHGTECFEYYNGAGNMIHKKKGTK